MFAVAFYAPLAFTFFLSGPEDIRLQDHVLAFLLSPAFAFGPGSGYDGHMETYVATCATMWLHTVVGPITLVAGLIQFSDKIRTARRKLHRVLGRSYVGGVLVVSMSACGYLLRTPAADIFSGPVFAEILWLLAFGTMSATVLAVIAIRRRDLISHRRFMTLSYAMICSAPLLRLGWIGTAQVWDATKEMINLTEVAWAGPLLVSCAIACLHTYGDEGDRDISALVSRPVLTVAGAASAASVAGRVAIAALGDPSAAIPDRFSPGWLPFIALAVVPWLAQSAWFARVAVRSRDAGKIGAHNAWRAYLVGNLAAPVAGLTLLVLTVTAFDIAPSVAVWSASVGWSVTLVTAFAVHAVATGQFLGPHRRQRTKSVEDIEFCP